jgi:hypothetical protein
LTARAGPSAATAHSAFKCSVTIPVIRCLFVSIFQDFVGLASFFELTLCVWFVCISVRVKFFRLLAIALFDLIGACAL